LAALFLERHGGVQSTGVWRRRGGVASRQYQLTWAPTPCSTALSGPRPTPTSPRLAPPLLLLVLLLLSLVSPLFMPTYGTAAARPGPTPFPARHPHVPRASPTGCSACIACIYAPSLNRDSAPIAPRAACDLPSAHMWLGAIRPLGSARSCKSLHARCANKAPPLTTTPVSSYHHPLSDTL
jgi:hypothetical protein